MLVGTAAADRFVAWRAAAALVVALGVQVAVNYANDYFDGQRGIDTPDRVGPRRAVAAGLVAPARMRAATGIALAVAGAAGLALAATTTWWLLVVGAVCFLAAVGYSGGPRPYASAGLGEVMVFVFFGLVATAGSQFVQDEALAAVGLAAGVPVGLLAVAILVANNLRDLETDRGAGKRTLAVRLGEARSRALYVVLLLGALAALPPVVHSRGSGWPLLALVAAPLAMPPARAVLAGAFGPRLVPVLVGTARFQLLFAALLAAGLVIGRAA